MPLSCLGISALPCPIDRSRVTGGHSGYTGEPHIAAIVIHLLSGISQEAYQSSLSTCRPVFLCDQPGSICQPSGNLNPLSVHFLVTQYGTTQYAEITDTTLGLDYLLQPTWPGLAALMPVTDVNGPFIHIAITSNDALVLLLNLLCCIQVELGYPVDIIAASDLQIDRPPLSISSTVLAQVAACVAAGGITPPPTVGDLENRIEVLEQCCLDNTSRIIVLEATDVVQNQRLTSLETRTTILETKVAALEDAVAVIPTLVDQVTILIGQVADILSRCCPKPATSTCFNYQLLPGDEMLVTPNQPVWLNLPTKVEDREVTCGNGNIVLPGPLWRANLCKSDDCGNVICGGNWSLEATVRFRLGSWCAGRKASLYLVACGKKYLLAEKVITTTSSQSVTLHGTFLLPSDPCCSDVHLLVATNDDNTTSAKVVEFAEFKGCCGA